MVNWLVEAEELEKSAKALREKAFKERPLPKEWKVGQKVKFITSQEWAWSKGAIWTIDGIREEYRGKPAAEYQVFYTSPGRGKGSFWTTPNDVELYEDI